MAPMCEVHKNEKIRALPVMRPGDDLLYFSSHVNHSVTYEKAINTLR